MNAHSFHRKGKVKGGRKKVRKAIILSNPWRAITRLQNLCQQGYSAYQEITTLLL